MPCAAGELCRLQECTPEAPDGHECKGGCGGRLHGSCGEMEDEQQEGNELHRICFACVNNAKQAAATSGAPNEAGAGKRKGTAEWEEEDFGDGSASFKRAKEKGDNKSATRKRLTLDEKLEILTLLDQGSVTHDEISDRYGCKPRTVRLIKAGRKKLEEQIGKERKAGKARKGSTKTDRAGEIP
ncbi:unnamed protein product, partial [Laminaria digitata]